MKTNVIQQFNVCFSVHFISDYIEHFSSAAEAERRSAGSASAWHAFVVEPTTAASTLATLQLKAAHPGA